jgi:hypothetical protein
MFVLGDLSFLNIKTNIQISIIFFNIIIKLKNNIILIFFIKINFHINISLFYSSHNNPFNWNNYFYFLKNYNY